MAHSGGEIVTATLEANGIATVFGIPGGHSFPIYAALAKAMGIRHVLGRHEQGLGYMADGYARATGRIAAISITSGPAVANLTCAMGQATTDGTPILVIASTPRSDLVGKNRGGLHDLNDSLDLARPVCRYVEHAASVDEISPKLASLIQRLREDRPGAAYLQVPTDVLAAVSNAAIIRHPPPRLLAPDAAAIHEAAAHLAQALRPLIIVGTGGMQAGAGPIARELADALGAVLSETTLARGASGCDAPWVIFPDGATPSAVDTVYERADVVLALGTSFRQEDTAGWTLALHDKVIHINLDAMEFGRSYRPLQTIQADAGLSAAAILRSLDRPAPADPVWRQFAVAQQARRLQDRRDTLTVDMAFAEAFRAALPREAMLIADRCNLGYWAFRCLPMYGARSFFYPLGYGGLGGALPQAVGARLADPDRPLLCLLGDGGLQFTLAELAVLVQEGLQIPILISNNGCYGAIRAGLRKNYGGLDFGTALSSPDYGAIAAAYGIPYTRIDDRAELLAMLPDAVSGKRLCIIDFQNDIVDP